VTVLCPLCQWSGSDYLEDLALISVFEILILHTDDSLVVEQIAILDGQ
jgi:hypothetical protein